MWKLAQTLSLLSFLIGGIFCGTWVLAASPPQKDLYQLLGARPDATPEELKKSYWKQVKRFHPDSDKRELPREQAEERFKKVAAAYEILSDPDKRIQYDAGAETQPLHSEERSSRFSADFDGGIQVEVRNFAEFNAWANLGPMIDEYQLSLEQDYEHFRDQGKSPIEAVLESIRKFRVSHPDRAASSAWDVGPSRWNIALAHFVKTHIEDIFYEGPLSQAAQPFAIELIKKSDSSGIARFRSDRFSPWTLSQVLEIGRWMKMITVYGVVLKGLERSRTREEIFEFLDLEFSLWAHLYEKAIDKKHEMLVFDELLEVPKAKRTLFEGFKVLPETEWARVVYRRLKGYVQGPLEKLYPGQPLSSLLRDFMSEKIDWYNPFDVRVARWIAGMLAASDDPRDHEALFKLTDAGMPWQVRKGARSIIESKSCPKLLTH